MFLARKLDDYLNKITMYRLVLYGLAFILTAGVILGFTGVLSISGTGLLVATAILVVVCYGSNRLIAMLYGAAPNSESSLITALILACILPPPTTWQRAAAIALAGLIAMASKYVLAVHKKHIFNPAAFAALAIGLLGFRHATWWVGSPSMLAFTLVVGFLVLRKIRRFELFVSFAAASVAMMLFVGMLYSQDASLLLKNLLLSWPLIFLGTIMLTEPATTPATNYYRNLYGVLVGALFTAQLTFHSLSTTPEAALLAGNLFAFLITPMHKLRLVLKEKRQLTPQVYDFVFEKPAQAFKFRAGQYMEWTLPHKHIDSRGNRRTFTIASSPTEHEIHLGVKFYKPSSSFKKALLALQPGAKITAGQLAGDFTLPHDTSKGLVFIAGGVGITPFRSMLQYMIDTDGMRGATLFYLIQNPKEAAYKDIIDTAKAKGLKVVYVLADASALPSWKGYTGKLTPDIITREVPNLKERIFYISGPNGMVLGYKSMLHAMHVKRRQIVADYFAGY